MPAIRPARFTRPSERVLPPPPADARRAPRPWRWHWRDAFEPRPAPVENPQVRTRDAGRVDYVKVDDGRLAIDGMSPDDVVQGELGDCFLLASLSVVAQQRPEVLKDLIRDNRDGTFTVTFHEGEKLVRIRVDAEVPRRASGKTPYGRARDEQELWVSLVEKAYAHWKGGYEAINSGGSPAGTLMELTGGRKEVFGVRRDPQVVFEKLRRELEAGSLMVAGTNGRVASGLVSPHAYSVLGAVEENGEQFIVLRNPWGRFEPGRDGSNDGLFKMPVAEFAKQFDYVDIVH